MNDEFQQTYASVVQYVSDRLRVIEPIRLATPFAEPPESVEHSLVELPRESLLSIANDSDFVVGVYCAVVNRLPYDDELEGHTNNIRTMAMSRADLIQRLALAVRYQSRGVRINVVA
ncbi:hypothetical protein [Microcella humidisoli]|uniref:Uncharacterized protein n=1 Tax=Microcella humidisoli TaxID=2963406 RepID=A0ABY5FUV7_9MICO|nr:hypothetical protein [Microcella humidisoli]UTT61924.1 hypothetical protein NNL39_09600 [Microcella humidisoli]